MNLVSIPSRKPSSERHGILLLHLLLKRDEGRTVFRGICLKICKKLSTAHETFRQRYGEQVREDKDPDGTTIDFTKSVYASFIKIDGLYYVKDLKNTPDTSTDKQKVCLVLPALPARPVQEDEKEALRYTLCDGAAFQSIKVHAIQGLLMKPPGASSCVGWPAPVSEPPVVINITALEASRRHSGGLRMRFFDCNAPDTLGYYVATDGTRLRNILTHQRGRDLDVSLFEDVESPIYFWIYMPIDQGEYLTDICRRAETRYWIVTARSFGVTFTTNHGRTVDFGFVRHEDVDFRRIAKLAPDPCRVYFNVDYSAARSRYSAELMAFEKHNTTSTDDELPKLPVSTSGRPHKQSSQDWLYSSCTMSRVTEIHACIDQTAPHRPVVGMLLNYADNHRECVGQFRPDWAIEPIHVGETDKIHICSKKTEQDMGHVVAVATCPPVQDSSDSWASVEQTGTLGWWFSSEHSVLCHDGTQLT
ncbi:hypothetical protein FSARC_4001 [Fusarium sarcochroum]|uniref:Uncharacterized protein n=1 Tax=Fusarium sarcochroum TaxID=1208366 RepID=A0A8H4XBY9_9HYPO|nr:hypothetical protein FSARC_4001 [Fusarium sarcochroum]